MKRLLVLVLVSVLVFMSSAMASRYEFNFDPGNIQFSSDQYGDVLEIEGCHLTGNSGDPFIPVKVGHVAADFGAEITGIKILEENWIELPAVYNLRPAPTPVPISYTGILPDVIPNDEIYTSESAYPSSPIQFTGGNKMRGYSLGGFMIYPLRYYPLSGRVEVLDRLVIELEYDNSFTAFTPSLEFGSVVARLVENPEVVQAQSMILSPVDPNDVKYLIITSSSLEPAFQALVEWYTRAGWPAESITLSEIQGSYPGDTDQLKTKACIQDYAENKGTLFVLIGGDDTVIPDQNCWGDVNNGGTTDNTIPTDLFLAGFDEEYDWNYDGDGKVGEVGDGYDLYPEVFISRAPVRTASHTEAFVNKTLNYIINQPDINFIDPMLLSGVELWNTWGGHSDADWRCEYMWEDYISFAWENHNRVRFYDTETDFGGPGYNVTPAHLQDLLNDGYHYLFMGTHGNQSGWGMEWYNGFESSHALDLMNEFNQGIIYTMACITNGFDSEGGYNYDPCLSEAFIRNSDGGAVGYQGCSRYGWGWANQSPNHGPSLQYADEFYMCLFFGDTHGNLPGDYPYRLAAASATHKAIKAPECQSQGVMRWLNFGINSVGDPALDLYTENPITMYPSYEKLIDITQESFEIYDVPDDALVCIWKGDEVYDYDVATSGTVTFANTALTTGTMFVTVTAHNYRPEIGCIGVYGTEPYVAFDSLNINDASGNNDGFVDCGEDIIMGVNMTNPGQNDAQNVEVIISTTDPYVIITDATHTFGTISGNGEAYEADAFSFSVANNTPENHLIRFEVRAEGDNFEICGSHIKIETHAPAIVSVYPPVMSEILAIGGSVENDLTVSNTGLGTLDFTATATVDGDDEWLMIDTDDGSIPPYGRDMEIEVTMDATDLTVGIYTGQVLIESNDPENPITAVPCTLSVVTTGIEDGTASLLPTSYSLSQNYPNPFNPVTTFKYALPVDSDVKLVVFNVYGQEVETLIDERQSAGYKSITWDATDYSSGIYFYKLSAGNKTFTKRMTLMK